jgi:hypothetical protein
MSLIDRLSPLPPTTARLAGADVVVAARYEPADLAHRLSRAVDGWAFQLDGIEPTVGGWRCRFVACRPDLSLSWANVTELQLRLGRQVDIVRVSRVDETDLWS